MNNYNNNMMTCNCDNERIVGDVLEIIGECVCDNGVEYLKNIVGDDVGNMIMDMKFDMEREYRIEEHLSKFNKCLYEIESKRWRRVYGDLERGLNYNMGYERIDVEFDIVNVDDGENILIELEINNCNNWTGFSSEDLLNDILINGRMYDEDECKTEYIERMFEEHGEEYDEYENMEYEELIEKYGLWFENTENSREWVDDCLYQMSYSPVEREEFMNWVSEEI